MSTPSKPGTNNLGLWVAVGLPFGVLIGVLIDNIGLGIALGLLGGVIIGSLRIRSGS